MNNRENNTCIIKKVRVIFKSLGNNAEAFWTSLGVKTPPPCGAFAEVEIDTEGTINIFGMDIPVKTPLLIDQETWDCKFIQKNRGGLFEVNNRVFAASTRWAKLDEVVHYLPDEIYALKGNYRSNLSLLARFTNLTTLYLSDCMSLTDLTPLSSLTKLTYLKLHDCNSLDNLTPLQFLTSLKTLSIEFSYSLKDFSPLSFLKELTSLHLVRCDSLNDLSELSCLTSLTSLECAGFNFVNTLSGLSTLSELEELSFSGSALTDVSELSSLKNLRELKLVDCESLVDLSPLSALAFLRQLSLEGCISLADIAPLANLKELVFLDLGSCSSLSTLSGLFELMKLKNINLAGCKSLKDISGLPRLAELPVLDFCGCKSLSDLSGLLGLKNVRKISFESCDKVSDLSALSTMAGLEVLNMSHCKSLSTLMSLPELKSVHTLTLQGCEALVDLSQILALPELRILDLSMCKSIKNLTGVSCLTKLSKLSLYGSCNIFDIKPLAGLAELRELDIVNLLRLDSDGTLETLSTFPKLQNVKHSLHPGDIAWVLANAAVARKDSEYINQNVHAWVDEAVAFSNVSLVRRERLAAALGSAFALLDPASEIHDRFEAYLADCYDFSAVPWKMWFQGSRDNWGFDVVRRRVERFPIATMPFGAVGGACSIMPVATSPDVERKWAVEWLSSLDDTFSSGAHELKPVMADVCLAYARLGDKNGLDRWLGRFADSSDPSALDPVQDALGRWCLGQEELESSLRHAAIIASDQLRDALLADIARAFIGSPSKAVEVLCLINTNECRQATALDLAINPLIGGNSELLPPLVAAAADSPSTLARLVESVGAFDGATDLLNQLSGEFASDPDSYLEWQKNQWIRFLKRFTSRTDIYPNMF